MHTIVRSVALLALAVLIPASQALAGGGYVQTNLVSNQPGVAQVTDPNLINPWGISFSGGSPLWVSNQGVGNQATATTTVYKVPASSGGLTVVGGTALTVGIPNLGGASPSDNNGPTGQVNTSAPGIVTGASDFPVNGSKAAFIFANLDGSVSAWNGGANATITASTIGASYTGLAIGNSGGSAFLYAADQNSTNVNIFNSQWQMTGHLVTDTSLAAGFTAFNVQNIGGILYVTYANPSNPLGGYVDEYNTNGQLITTLISDPTGTHLQTPWGVAIAPSNWGAVRRRPARREQRRRRDDQRLYDQRDLGGPDHDRQRAGVQPGRAVGHDLRQRRQRRLHGRPLLRRRPPRRDQRPVRRTLLRPRAQLGGPGPDRRGLARRRVALEESPARRIGLIDAVRTRLRRGRFVNGRTILYPGRG